ncbi:MAG: hypothetical protein EPN48_16650 [Microbacteriaceae bacterium]|nr:MAG: hypothetical protein EPN48_16650 [Microbacteriaceae bacterium]
MCRAVQGVIGNPIVACRYRDGPGLWRLRPCWRIGLLVWCGPIIRELWAVHIAGTRLIPPQYVADEADGQPQEVVPTPLKWRAQRELLQGIYSCADVGQITVGYVNPLYDFHRVVLFSGGRVARIVPGQDRGCLVCCCCRLARTFSDPRLRSDDQMISLSDWNQMREQEALEVLYKCSPSLNWASGVVALRPYRGLPELLASVRDQWKRFESDDWLQLIAAHDRLADANREALSAESKGEQATIYESDPYELEELVSAAGMYEQQFGFIFITAVRGRTISDILREIRERSRNSEIVELRVASGNLKSIAEGRLRRTFSEDE